jgi:hypothetical protein
MTLYAQRNPRNLEPHLSRHMQAMTAEGLHDKGDIACELAWRDAEIERIWLEYAEYRICVGSENDLRDAEIARLHSDLETAERALDAQTDFRKEIERLRERIAITYGYLWHANDEPGTPNRYGSERAAIEARKVLREILTGEQRGKGINAARAAIVGADMNKGK